MNSQTRFSTRKRILLFAVISALLIFVLSAFDPRLVVRHYTVESDEIDIPIRIALVTDLHSCDYGKNQINLIHAIDAQNPDLILLGGDIFDEDMEDTNSDEFLAGIAGRYPCYFVIGNHECRCGIERSGKQMALLEKYSIPVLSGQTAALELNGETVNLCGMHDPEIYRLEIDINTDPKAYAKAQAKKEECFISDLAALSEASDGTGFTVLLSHRPEYFETYEGCSFDLVLCGHAHGGQWRIPGIVNGLYAPHQGLFPNYAGGRYDSENMTMIVSRGLARETTRVPRIFNRPEVVIIDVK